MERSVSLRQGCLDYKCRLGGLENLVLLLSWLGLWIFSRHGCARLCGPRSRLEEEGVGRTTSIRTESRNRAWPWLWVPVTSMHSPYCNACLMADSLPIPGP